MLTDRIVLVTGAGGGIGAEISREVRRRGGRLVMTDVDETAAVLAEELDAPFLKLDVTNEGDWKRVAASVEAEFGALHGLVNNAGLILMKPLVETSLEEFRRINAVSSEGTFLGMRAFAPLLARSGEEMARSGEEMARSGEEMAKTGEDVNHGTAIVNFSSIYGLGGQPFFSAYCAAKGAVRLITKSAALEFAQLGWRVRVNSVHPGPIDTPLARAPLEALVETGQIDSMESALASIAASYPGGRIGHPDDVAGVVVFLLSDDARFLNGIEVPVDAGLTAKAQ